MKQAIGKLKIGKVLGVDGIRAEMLKYGGEAIMNILASVSGCIEDM